MHTIKIGGVPEHFNLPWHLTIEEGAYLEKDIELEWIDFPGGTGAMCEALRNNDIDIAIILTEGIIKDIIAGSPTKIVQTYIQSPLVWGIHVGHSSKYTNLSDLQNTSAAISRYGSGSHLMAYVNAQNNGWDTSALQFEVVKNLDGAVKALTDGNADYFMWEHFTTKPLVDNKTFRRIADCPTPWPCFVIAVREEILDTKKDRVKDILQIINNTTVDFKQIPSIDKTLSLRYDQQLQDIRDWIQITEWSQSLIKSKTLNQIQNQLFKLDIIDKIIDPKDLISEI
ncbi:ABC-type nitrate/sulfonate/bicarbonate transport system, substrate-binding protein [Aquimarina amphilecti]|uniref:ABC-type nitrate/sulfonate/bicarbonate transport system, substrate-binding protein n=1 Tax=Aquimarina amphilecti TaxID=1038014 RepID=A0A1H7HV23_AQUAM|nr:substrate-binding domain-containing protein [Aquimarina amphilecti]SEK54119.1 ABC-type nitrate/sulfonate/bicarbonate transport system, substrate-binding protein [Aquimarina amphilecti]